MLSKDQIAANIAAGKAQHDKPENRIVRDGEAICRQCLRGWDHLIHGC